MRFDATQIGDDVDAYLARVEARFDDIRPGAQKRVVWAGTRNAKTPVALLYVHGFSATSQEIRPVPDRVAAALGANLVFTRLAGHGRTGPAMAEATLDAWMQDMAEGLAVARAVGEAVLVLSTSTGSTLSTLAALDPVLSAGVRGQVFVSPNFGLKARGSAILTWPLVRYWGPIVAGAERSFEPRGPDHARYWTTRYPTIALLPMAAAVKQVRRADLAPITQPLLVMFAEDDEIVSAQATRATAARWGGSVTLDVVRMGPGDDPASHLIAGDILSPGQTDRVVAAILAWSERL